MKFLTSFKNVVISWNEDNEDIPAVNSETTETCRKRPSGRVRRGTECSRLERNLNRIQLRYRTPEYESRFSLSGPSKEIFSFRGFEKE